MKIIASSARTYLVQTLNISNKEAISIIAEQQLLVNGKPIKINQPILSTDQITFQGKILKDAEEYIYLAYHKPRGIETTLNKEIKNNLSEALDFPERVFPAGRLDKESEGLLILTNDGYTFEKIINSNEEQEKEYIVSVNKILTPHALEQLSSGVEILGKITKPAKVKMINDYTFQIILTQGLNRQIRRMCHKLGYQVNMLKRIRIINILLDELPVGQWRKLTEKEVEQLTKINKK